MRLASPLILAAGLFAATPAFATSSIHCRTQPRGPELWLGIGSSDTIGLFQVRILNGREEISTGASRGGPRLTQSFVNPRSLSFRLAAGRVRGSFASLTAARRGVPYIGTFTWQGRTWPVRCFWDEDDEG